MRCIKFFNQSVNINKWLWIHEMIVQNKPCTFALTQQKADYAGRRLTAGASFRLRIVFVDSAKYVFPPSGRLGTPCVMLRSAVNYEDNFESCVCVLHITSFRLREFLPCKPICFKPTTTLPSHRHCHPRITQRRRANHCRTDSTIVIKRTDLNGNLSDRGLKDPSILARFKFSNANTSESTPEQRGCRIQRERAKFIPFAN